jgi:hypothetical protein
LVDQLMGNGVLRRGPFAQRGPSAPRLHLGPQLLLERLVLADAQVSLSRLNVKCRQNLEIRYYGANVVTSCFLECQKPGELKTR